MVNSRGHKRVMARCRPTPMATLQFTVTKATIGDRVPEAVNMASTRVVCTGARVTKGTMTRPTRTQITCKETRKRTTICGKCSVDDGLWTYWRSSNEAHFQCSFAVLRCLRPVFFASVFRHSGWLGLTESVIRGCYSFGDQVHLDLSFDLFGGVNICANGT